MSAFGVYTEVGKDGYPREWHRLADLTILCDDCHSRFHGKAA